MNSTSDLHSRRDSRLTTLNAAEVRTLLGTKPLSNEPFYSDHIFELERTKIFKRAWLRVAMTFEIPNAGDYKVKRIDVARTSVIIVREKSGEIRAFHNVCPHRGNKVIPEASSAPGAETHGCAEHQLLTCHFHGWVFQTDGALRGVPRANEFADLDKRRRGLRSIACEIWGGFIFINLDPSQSQGLSDYLSGIDAVCGGYPYEKATAVYQYSAVLNCNWKVALYAFSESYHVPTIHASTLPAFVKIDHTDFKLLGNHSSSALYGGGMDSTPATQRFGRVLVNSAVHGPSMNDLPGGINRERRKDFQFELTSIFPNFLLHVGAGCGYPGIMYFTHQFWPISATQTLWEGANHFLPPQSPSEKLAQLHVNAMHRNGWLEDTATMESTQEGVESGAIADFVLMDKEFMIRNSARAIERALDA